MGLFDRMVNKGKKAIKNKVKTVAIKGAAALAGAIIHILPYILIVVLVACAVYTAYYTFTDLFNKNTMTLQNYYIFKDGLLSDKLKFDKDALYEEIDSILGKMQSNGVKLRFESDDMAKEYFYQYFTAVDASFLPYIEGSEIDGLVKVKRTFENTDLTQAKELKYIVYNKFEEKIENYASDVFDYFTIDANFRLCVATYTKVTVNNVVQSYEITPVSIPYRNMISQYTIPRELLVALYAASENPEYVMAVANLVKDNGLIDFIIFDNKTTTTDEYAYTCTRHENGYTETTGHGAMQGQPIRTTYKNRTHDLTRENNTTTTVTEINVVTANVTQANVWIINSKTNYECEQSVQYLYGRNGRTEELSPLDEPSSDEAVATWDTNRHEYKFQSVETNTWHQVGTENKITANKFLGLWMNSTGTYESGADFLPETDGGKKVEYKIPIPNTSGNEPLYEAPIIKIIGGSDKWLYDFLETGENAEITQNLVVLMKYMMKLYKLQNPVGDSKLIGMDLGIYTPEEFIQSGVGSGNVRHTNLSLEEFLEIVNNYTPPNGRDKDTGITFQEGYNTYFKPYAEDFYNIAIEYELNPEFIFAIGLHESQYGTSRIIRDKNNAFGYGAVDGAAYEKAWTFESMKEGIEQECKDLANKYLNPNSRKYKLVLNKGYNPETIEGIGSLYASDGSWAKKVKTYMRQVFGYIGTGNEVYTEDYIMPENPKGQDIVTLARTKLGSRYIWGTQGPNTFDCSGFVYWVYKTATGITVPRTTATLMQLPTKNSRVNQAQPGDILLRAGHTGIYIGNNQYIHASNPATGVKISDHAFTAFDYYIRILPTANN